MARYDIFYTGWDRSDRPVGKADTLADAKAVALAHLKTVPGDRVKGPGDLGRADWHDNWISGGHSLYTIDGMLFIVDGQKSDK